MTRSPCLARVFGFAFAACVALGPSAASGANCSKAVQTHLDHLRVDYGDIADQRLIPRKGGQGRIVAYDAWFWFQSCSGNLVVQLNRSCQVRQTYWRGDCPGEEAPEGDGSQ